MLIRCPFSRCASTIVPASPQGIALDYLTFTAATGIGATALLDLWALARLRMFGVRLPDYGLIGRWLGHLARGRFGHESIAASAAVRAERLIGWIAHYLIGVAFAALLPVLWGRAWMQHPTIGPALIVGIGTVAFPFLVMQPGMGAGIAASRTPNPATARLQSLVTHCVFGIGLYAAGWLASRA